MLETKRLFLKPHTLENAEKMNKWANDPELAYYDDDEPERTEPLPVERTRRYLERITTEEDEGIIRFGIHKREDDSLIGLCMIAFIDRYNKNCKIGISIGEKSEWGKGFGSEVIAEIVRYCFEDLDMNRIGAEIYAFNQRSMKLFEGAGFKREGIIRELVYKKGRFEDEYIYGILRSEWARN